MFSQKAQGRLGGLSINTASANSTTPQPSLSGNLFGAAQQDKPASISFTSTGGTSQPQQGGSLFASLGSKPADSQAMTSAPQPSTSIFGGTLGAQGTAGTQQSNSIFGSGNAQQPQAQQSVGLFGNSLQAPSQTQTTQPQTSSVFGALGTSNTGSSLFGKPLASSQPQPVLSLPAQPNSIFSSSIGQLSQQQQVVPGVRVTLNELRPTTRFNDLHEELQRIIENVDNFILQQMEYRKECEAAIGKINAQTETIPKDKDHCKMSLEHLQRALENDAEAIAQAKSMTKADVHDARLSWNVIDQLKMPPQFQHTGIWNTPSIAPNSSYLYSDGDGPEGASRDLVGYFSKQADNMSNTLNAYKRGGDEVNDHLQSLEVRISEQLQQSRAMRGNGRSARSAEDQVRDLAAVLREFEGGIIGVAGKLGAARECLESATLLG